MRQFYRTDPRFVQVTVAFWLLLSLFTVIKAGLFRALDGHEVYWAHISSYTLTSAVCWIGVSLLVWRWALRPGVKAMPLLRLAGWHLLLAPVVVAGQRLVSMTLDFAVQTQVLQLEQFPGFSEYLSGHFARRWTEGLLWYALLVVAVHGYVLVRGRGLRSPSTDGPADLLRMTEGMALGKTEGVAFRENEGVVPTITIRKKGALLRVPLSNILYIKSEGNYCLIHTDTTVHKMRGSLKALAAEWAASPLLRIHHSTLVNTDRVVSYQHVQNGDYRFRLPGTHGHVLSSKTYREQARQLIQQLDQ